MINTGMVALAEFEQHDGRGRRRGNEIRFLCPFPECAGKQGKGHQSLAFDISTGFYHCHRCNAKGRDGAYKTEAERQADTDKFRNTRVWIDPKEKARQAQIQRRAKVHAILSPTVSDDDNLLETYRLGSLQPLAGTSGEEYLLSRGLTLDQCGGVRYSPNFGRRHADEKNKIKGFDGVPAVVFAVRDDKTGKLVAAQGRIITPWQDGPKMLTLGARVRGVYATPSAWERATSPLAICEGPIDALTLASVGLDAIALCGCGPLPDWVMSRLMHRAVVYLAHDNDNAGNEAAARLSDDIKRATFGAATLARLVPKDAKDFNEVLMRDGHAGLVASIGICPVRGKPILSPCDSGLGESMTPNPSQDSGFLMGAMRLLDIHTSSGQAWLENQINVARSLCETCPDDDLPFALATLESFLWARDNGAQVTQGYWLNSHAPLL
jgi:hypothetical protein